MPKQKIIIRNLQQLDYALLSKELNGQGITPVSVEEVPGRFGEPMTISVILALGAATSLTAVAIGFAAWLMKRRETNELDLEFDIEHSDGRIEHRKFHHKVSSESETDPELLKALKDALPNFGQASGLGASAGA